MKNKTFTITHEQRLDLLKAYNDLNSVLSTLTDCHDMYISDVRSLESLDSKLRSILKFKSESNYHYYTTYELAENVKKQNK